MKLLLDALANTQFVENAALLVIAAILTGILVPLVKAIMDQAKFKKQKLFEAALARQSGIITAQRDLLAELSELIWKYQFVQLEVSYDRTTEGEDYKEALDKYEAVSWDMLAKIRATIGKARWFTSDTTYETLTSFYKDWIISTDQKLMGLVLDEKTTDSEWGKHHDWFYAESARRADTLMRQLAEDFGFHEISEADESVSG